MIDVDLPDTNDVPVLVRSFAACMASVSQTPVADVPQPHTDLSVAVAHWRSWRSWLAGKGAGLAAITKPAQFNWPGYWLAVLSDLNPARRTDHQQAVLMFGTPSGVVLSPQDTALLGVAASDLSIRQGYVLCPLDPAFVTAQTPPPPLRGTVEAIALTGQATEQMRTVEHAQALIGRGLAGDRYAAKAGTFYPSPRPHRPWLQPHSDLTRATWFSDQFRLAI